MLSDAQRALLTVVLVRPRNPLNIGAVARAMANFGLGRLTVVSPYEPHWREARSAVGAPELLAEARATESLAEALAEQALVIGTGTLTYRKPEQPVVLLPRLTSRVDEEVAAGGRVALVFGPEKHGLTREDLSLCHLFVEIPTDARQPSMNLGQAVAVCLYEIAGRASERARAGGETDTQAAPGKHSAPSGNLELAGELIERTMLAAGYSPRAMQAANRHDLRVLLRRLHLNQGDLRRILGLFRRILWRLEGNSQPRT